MKGVFSINIVKSFLITALFGASNIKAATYVEVLTKPIGHSLNGLVEKKRIELLLAQKNVVNVKENTAVSKGESQAPLIGGQYGFPVPNSMDGVPKAFVSLGNLSPSYGIVVEKLHHRLSIFKLNAEKKYEVVKTFRAITGKDPGDKISRGDLRTPEGIYFITGQKRDDALPPKYGRLALLLDYPNIYDKRVRKSGSGIWIHATDDPSRLLRPFDTEGCVAVSNEDVVEIAKYVTPFETPVVITKEMTTVPQADLEVSKTAAIEMINAWKNSWEKSDFTEYMKFYSKNFVSLGMNKNVWETYKSKLSKQRNADIKIRISEPKILAFENQLLAVFMQEYSSSEHSDFGQKFLYLQWEGDKYRVIAEKWYRARKTDTALRNFRPM